MIYFGLKNTWIPACCFVKQLSHLTLTWGHFLLVLRNNFVRGWLGPLAIGKVSFKSYLASMKVHMSWTTDRIGRSSSSASLLIILFHCIKGIPACRVGLDLRLHGSHRFFKSHAPVEGNVWPLFHCSFNVTKCNLGKVKLEPIMLLSSFSSFAWCGPYALSRYNSWLVYTVAWL